MENVIEVRNLVKKFGDFTAVNNISFDVQKGEIFGFLGAMGNRYNPRRKSLAVFLSLLFQKSIVFLIVFASHVANSCEFENNLGIFPTAKRQKHIRATEKIEFGIIARKCL